MSNEPLQEVPGRDSGPFADPRVRKLLKHVTRKEIPRSEELYTAPELEQHLQALGDPPLSLVAVGDILLGDRAKDVLKELGPDYPFEAVLPLLQRASIVLGNLEGPLARRSPRVARNYVYKMKPTVAAALVRARFNVLTLANNHVFDCGRQGVLETLDALRLAGIDVLGAGADERAAHVPVIREAGGLRIGLLGYYWHLRCAAEADLPGAAMDTFRDLRYDIRSLREKVDRLVVTFHWGIPYQREVSPVMRAKARFAVDCGADAVIGHHSHIVQPFEIYRGCPIFYGVGNFTFGSGNSRAEGLMVGIRFEERQTIVVIYPLYVKNRDPRVNYQPKILRGACAERMLRLLAESSGPSGGELRIERGHGTLRLERPAQSDETVDGIRI